MGFRREGRGCIDGEKGRGIEVLPFFARFFLSPLALISFGILNKKGYCKYSLYLSGIRRDEIGRMTRSSECAETDGPGKIESAMCCN